MAMKENLSVWLFFLVTYYGTSVILDLYWTDSIECFKDDAEGLVKGFVYMSTGNGLKAVGLLSGKKDIIFLE